MLKSGQQLINYREILFLGLTLRYQFLDRVMRIDEDWCFMSERHRVKLRLQDRRWKGEVSFSSNISLKDTNEWKDIIPDKAKLLYGVRLHLASARQVKWC